MLSSQFFIICAAVFARGFAVLDSDDDILFIQHRANVGIETDEHATWEARSSLANEAIAGTVSCLKIQTGFGERDDGYLTAVLFFENSPFRVVADQQYYEQGQYVIDQCLEDKLTSIHVQNKDDNEWAGYMEHGYFIPGAASNQHQAYMYCTHCSGREGVTNKIVVDGNGDSGDLGQAVCWNSNSCIVHPAPTPSPTPVPPTRSPTQSPPTLSPTPSPTASPTLSPTASPTLSPTALPTFSVQPQSDTAPGLLDFQGANLTDNDLGAGGIIFSGVTADRTTDLAITNTTPYLPSNSSANGMSGLDSVFAQINLKCGTQTSFSFALQDAGTGLPKELPAFNLTVADLDRGMQGRCREALEVTTVSNPPTYYAPPSTSLLISEVPGGMRFTSTAMGSHEDNPQGMDLDDGQLNKAVELMFTNTQFFTITLFTNVGVDDISVDEDVVDEDVVGYGGRLFLFSGMGLTQL